MSSISITWELIRKVNYQVLHRPTELEFLGVGPGNSFGTSCLGHSYS